MSFLIPDILALLKPTEKNLQKPCQQFKYNKNEEKYCTKVDQVFMFKYHFIASLLF